MIMSGQCAINQIALIIPPLQGPDADCCHTEETPRQRETQLFGLHKHLVTVNTFSFSDNHSGPRAQDK